MVAIGDSKTIGYGALAKNGYRNELAANLSALPGVSDAYFVDVLASSGWTMAQVWAALPAFLASEADVPEWVLMNVGTPDLPNIGGSTTEAAWKSALGNILDALHAKWPSAQIRLMRPIWLGYEANAATMNDTWMPAVLATRAAFAAVGPDERVFLDATTLPDGIHPSDAGYTLTASEWQTAMGLLHLTWR